MILSQYDMYSNVATIYDEHIKTSKVLSLKSKPKVIIMTTSKTVKFVMTNGLLATGFGLNKPTLAKICFAIQDNDSVVVTVESARNGNTINSCGKKIITRDELRAIPDSQYDDMVFNRAAFAMMGLSF